jgi:hypothetical protein
MLLGGSIVIGIQLLTMLLMWNKFQASQDMLVAKQESFEAQSMKDSRLRSEIQVARTRPVPILAILEFQRIALRQHFKLELLETALELNETRDAMETLSSKLQATELQLHSYRLQLKRGTRAHASRRRFPRCFSHERMGSQLSSTRRRLPRCLPSRSPCR